ncbi:MAG: hypothetical protein C0412_06445 [Flavobacterium sp.]|nr:hypothetical protein [Flavobacterium sp.]
MKFTKTHENLIIISIIIIAFFFWHSIFVFPIKLITVIFHEFSHVLAILISGGTVISVEITNDLGGITKSVNTNETVVLCCGYLGSVILGISIYLFSHKQKQSRIFLSFISLIIFLFGLIAVKNDFGKFSSVAISFVFLAMILIMNPKLFSIILKTIALINISYVINDVIYDTFLQTSFFSDAVRLEQLTGINDWIWGAGWLLVAAAAMYFIVRHMLKLKKK